MDKPRKEISLLKKGQKGFWKAIFSRVGLFALVFVAQALLIFCVFKWFEDFLPHFFGGTFLFTLIMVLYLINLQMDPTAKITWLVIILLLPIFGSLLFLYTQKEVGHRAVGARVKTVLAETRHILPQDLRTAEAFQRDFPDQAALAGYIAQSGCYPVYENTDVRYFPSGEAAFPVILDQLDRAEHFIFMEYFEVDEGMMWGEILEILAEKAAQGVDVRVLYDGTNEFFTLPPDYPQRLKELGIQCKMFAPLKPFVSTHYNYRDHRKITVVDGHTAFTGGINLTDAYINHVQNYGYWKDAALMLQGDAVPSFTLMFLQMWNLTEREPVFDPFLSRPTDSRPMAQGYVLPYGDCPLDHYKVGRQVYIDILNRAQSYVHIFSPYLILDGELENAMLFAAERGVDVSVILPGISDQFVPHALATTHYRVMLEAGVHVYEFTPGYVHAKIFVSDDREAVVGTINLDYRSLYHHYECGAYLCGVPCIRQIESDFESCRKQAEVITSLSQIPLRRRAVGALVKVIAPLL